MAHLDNKEPSFFQQDVKYENVKYANVEKLYDAWAIGPPSQYIFGQRINVVAVVVYVDL